jgi:peptidoglycan/xylan/chitin deacetylase (PgdA/CDA1 family)
MSGYFKNLVTDSLRVASVLWPTSLCIRITGRKELLPFYHAVSPDSPVHLRHLYPIRTLSAFQADLDYYREHFRPVYINELAERFLRKNSSGDPVFWLSFDDGLREIYDHIFPILRKNNIQAGIFINPAFIDNKDLFFRYKASILIESSLKAHWSSTLINEIRAMLNSPGSGLDGIRKAMLHVGYSNRDLLDQVARVAGVDFNEYLEIHQPYLSSFQLEEMASDGWIIGAHSMNHPLYSCLELPDQLFETCQSLEYVEKHFRPSHKLFAFPFTDFDVGESFFSALYNKKQMCDMSFGASGLKKEERSQHVQRIPMEGTGFSAGKIIKGEYLYYMLKAPFGKNRIKRNS